MDRKVDLKKKADCWICGETANSGEHRIKNTDLKNTFGRIDEQHPVYLRSESLVNKPISSARADKLKFRAPICCACNNQLTQPYDKSWEVFSGYIVKNKAFFSQGSEFPVLDVFNKKQLLHVHLFFVKLFGCLIKEHGISIDIKEFAEAIKSASAHPNVFLAIVEDTIAHDCKLESGRHVKSAGYTDLYVAKLDGKVVFAVWFYRINGLAVRVMYAESGQFREGLSYSWHPDNVPDTLHIAGIE